jgi:hypothetical protein
MEQYQDIWVRGSLKSKGVREVESRYELIKSQAQKYERPFTVLDIGANLGYFSIRLTEDFPNCTAIAIEGMYGDWLKTILQENANNRIILLQKTFTLENLKSLADVEHFDLVLAMSVIHHIKGGFSEVLKTIRSLGTMTIAEIATEDGACGQESVKTGFVPDDAEIIGHGKSHLHGPERPIFVLRDKKETLAKSYLGTPRPNSHNLTIKSDLRTKKKLQRGQELDWHRGINLKTFLSFNGSFPSKEHIVEQLNKAKPNIWHGDLTVHNTILQGDAVQFIDWFDPGVNNLNDEETFPAIIRQIQSLL